MFLACAFQNQFQTHDNMTIGDNLLGAILLTVGDIYFTVSASKYFSANQGDKNAR